MKDRKLRVRVTGIARDFYLFKLKTGGALCVKFFPPLAVREKLNCGRLFHSTGTTEPAAAAAIAAQFIAKHWWPDRLEANGVLMIRVLPTMREILKRYHPPEQLVSAATAAKNRNSMRMLVRQGAGVSDPDNAVASLLNGETVKEFKRCRLAAVVQKDLVEQERAAVTINSTIRQARSVFARDWMHFYDDLALPETLKDFMAVPYLRVDQDMSFVPFAPGVIERIEAELPEQTRNVQLATILMLYLGLRNKEVEFARWDWFRWFGDGTAEISIERRPYFKVKNNSVRSNRLEQKLAALLAPFREGYRDDDWVIDAPAKGETIIRDFNQDRYEVTHYEINAWLRTIITDRQKCAYELRKHGGSMVLTRTPGHLALAEAARFLGDTIQTTERHYARLLKSVTGLEPGAASAARFEVLRNATAA